MTWIKSVKLLLDNMMLCFWFFFYIASTDSTKGTVQVKYTANHISWWLCYHLIKINVGSDSELQGFQVCIQQLLLRWVSIRIETKWVGGTLTRHCPYHVSTMLPNRAWTRNTHQTKDLLGPSKLYWFDVYSHSSPIKHISSSGSSNTTKIVKTEGSSGPQR